METTTCEAGAAERIGFDLDRFRYDGPWPEPLPEDGDCLVFNGGDSTARELLKGNTQPVLAIRREVWDEISYLVNVTPNREMAMFLVLKPFDSNVPKYVAVDLFFPKQETGTAGVSLDGPSTEGFCEDIAEHPDYAVHLHRRLCHLHSHGSMGLAWSEVDRNQQTSRDDLAFKDDFRYYVVVNAHGEAKCCFTQYEPFVRRFDEIPIVVTGKPTELSEERKAELEGWVRDRTSPLTSNTFEDLRPFDPNGTETYVPYRKPQAEIAVGRDFGDRWLADFDEFGGYGEEEVFSRRDLEERTILEEFVDFLIGSAPVEVSELLDRRETCREIDRILKESDAESAKVLMALREVDRHDAYDGFVMLQGTDPTQEPEDFASDLVAWMEWLAENEDNLSFLGPFLRRRQ